jgi:hypothetical protein
MDMNVSMVINEQRLTKASKKFLKACDQIKILKQQIAELIAMFTYYDPQSSKFQNAQKNTLENDFNITRLRESLKQQIENLQGIKTAYFIYAHRKADEITKLQCELYGEDAVREAYENGTSSTHASSSSSSTSTNNSMQEEPQVDNYENSSNANDEHIENDRISNEERDTNRIEEENQFDVWTAYPQPLNEQHQNNNAWSSWQFNPTPITHYNHQFST